MTDPCPTCGQDLPKDLPLYVDLEVNVAVANGVAVALTGMEAELLSVLAAPPIKTRTKEFLMMSLYPIAEDTEEKIIDVMVCKMRRKIAKAGIVIETVWGRGYRIDCKRKKAA